MPAETYPITLIGTEQMIVVPFSFEANEKGTIKLAPLPYRAKVKTAKTVMQKAAGASDTGTVDIKKASTTYATVTVAASAAIGEEDTATASENAFDTDEQITVVTTKTTAGGKGLLFLTLEVLPSH